MKDHFTLFLFFSIILLSCTATRTSYESKGKVHFVKSSADHNVTSKHGTQNISASSFILPKLFQLPDSCDKILLVKGDTILARIVSVNNDRTVFEVCSAAAELDSIKTKKILMIDYASGRKQGVGAIGQTYKHPDESNIYAGRSLALAILSVVSLFFLVFTFSPFSAFFAILSILFSSASQQLEKRYPTIFRKGFPAKLSIHISVIVLLINLVALLIFLA